MGISYISVISFTLCIFTLFSYLFTITSVGTVYTISKVLFWFGSILCVAFAILAKRHRQKHNLYGRGLEIAAIIIWSYIMVFFCTTIGLNDILGFFLIIPPIVIYSKTSYSDTANNDLVKYNAECIVPKKMVHDNSVRPSAPLTAKIEIPQISHPTQTNLFSKSKIDPIRKHYRSEDVQSALNRWKLRNKTDWEIGIEYERYIGYLLECEGYKVQYVGATQGLNDMGRDLIAVKKNKTLVIQCKRWSTNKTIHEKHIFQLHGSTAVLIAENPEKNYKPVFITTTELSEKARKCADICNVTCIEHFPISDYPLIKCNSNADGEKIYHLPFDPQYDKIVITKNKKSFYAWTVEEAEEKGFRPTYQWRHK